jgi:hypothetical protein
MNRLLPLTALCVLVLSGCAATPQPRSPEAGLLHDRLSLIDTAVSGWAAADSLDEAHRFAEEARNLVVGPDGPYFGDADSDGTISGDSGTGVLPGLEGQPGSAQNVGGECVLRDVLGGSWANPADRWAILETAITDWGPANNTFPALPSHPQRVVGWATLALATDSLDSARGYAGHAALHVRVSQVAVEECAN